MVDTSTSEPTLRRRRLDSDGSMTHSRKDSHESLNSQCSAKTDGSAGSDDDARRKALPDLTKKLVKAGIYEEYISYRDNYRKWRKGGHKGAQGEVVDVGKQANGKDPYKFELWFPTPQKFHFFFTVSYWGAILFLEGSLFFVLTSALPYVGERNAAKTSLIHWGNLIGGTIFTVGCYFYFLELINVQHVERVRLFPLWNDYKLVLQRVRLDSFMGTMIYFAASISYNIMCFAPFFPSWISHDSMLLLGFFGGLGFLIGGICEVSHTCFGDHGHGLEVGAVAAWLNCIGGLLFFLAGAGEFASHDYIAVVHFCMLLGSVLYVIASALLLVMWQCNDFGGTLLNQLNHAICAGNSVSIDPNATTAGDGVHLRVAKATRRLSLGADEMRRNIYKALLGGKEDASEVSHKKKLSLRGVISLCLYCWVFVCATSNVILGVPLFLSGDRFFSDVAMTLILVLGVKVVLVVHSTLTMVPNEQPYRFAMQSMWFLLFCAAAVQTVGLISSIPLTAAPIAAGTQNSSAAFSGSTAQLVQPSAHGGEL